MTKTILVVDDVDGVRREMGYLLEDNGYTVIQAENGAQACRQLLKNNFELVITDILMPEMDGFELSAFIRARYPETKIIAISGGGRSYVNNAQGVNDLLRQVDKIIRPDALLKKPFESDKLLQQVDRLLKTSTHKASE